MARDIKSTNYYKKKSRVSTKIETNSLVKECEEVNHAAKTNNTFRIIHAFSYNM